MEMQFCSKDIVLFCRLMQLLYQFGTLSLRTLMIKLLFVRYIQSRRATFTYFADGEVVVKEHVTGGGSGYSTKYRVPNPLPDIEKCVKDSKDGEALQNYIEVTFLTETVNNHYTKLLDLKKKNIMNKMQFETLFSNTTVNIHDLDLSLLSLLLFNLFDLKPTAGMKSLPVSCNISEADDVLRLRIYRNKIAHLKCLQITAIEFESMWRDISCAVVRLLGSAYQNDINRLKVTNFDEAAVIQYKQLRKEWSENVTDIYQSLSDIQEELRSIRTVKRRPKHRKGVAIQLVNSDNLEKALRVLKKKGITTKVISLDETDSDSSDSLVEIVSNRRSKSVECLEHFEGEGTLRACRSTTHVELDTLRAKEMVEPFHEMFRGNETNKSPYDTHRRWSVSVSTPQLTEDSTSPGCQSIPSTSSCGSVFEDNKDKEEPPPKEDNHVESVLPPNGLKVYQPDKVPDINLKTKRKSLWRSFQDLF